MNIGKMRRRCPSVTHGDSYPKIISLNNNTYYTRVSSDDLSVRAMKSEKHIGIVIDLGKDVQINNIEFTCGIRTATARLMAYDSYGINQLQHIYSPVPRSLSLNLSVRTIYFSVYKDTKEDAYILDRTHNRYIFNGSTDWSKIFLMTTETNPEVLSVCYAQLLCASLDYMTFEEATAVTDIGSLFRESNIVHFDELQYFGITRISANAFRSCASLESIKIGENVTTVLNYVFLGCTRLTTVEIGENVTLIGQQCFQNLTGLTSVIIHATQPPTIFANTFSGANNAIFYVPANSINDYKSANIWSNYADRIFAIPTNSKK